MDTRFVATLCAFFTMRVICANAAEPAKYADEQRRPPSVRFVDDVHPSGMPIPVLFTVRNATGTNQKLAIERAMLPYEVQLSVLDASGKKIKPGPMATSHSFPAGTRGGIADSEPLLVEIDALKTDYNWVAGETVSIGSDLARLYDLRRPGRYRLRVRYVSSHEGEYEFTVSEFVPLQKCSVEAECTRPAVAPHMTGLGTVAAGCDVTVGRADDRTEKGRWYVKVDEVRHWCARRLSDAMIMQVEPDTTVERAELDFKWQLWTILESHERRALVVWDLLRGDSRTAIPWSDAAIEIGTTRARRDLPANVVIAGQPGKEKMTSLSFGIERVRKVE